MGIDTKASVGAGSRTARRRGTGVTGGTGENGGQWPWLEADVPPRNMKKHMIVVGFRGGEKSAIRHACSHILNKIFKCEIEFLLDQFGEVLYPEQWLRECQAIITIRFQRNSPRRPRGRR